MVAQGPFADLVWLHREAVYEERTGETLSYFDGIDEMLRTLSGSNWTAVCRSNAPATRLSGSYKRYQAGTFNTSETKQLNAVPGLTGRI